MLTFIVISIINFGLLLVNLALQWNVGSFSLERAIVFVNIAFTLLELIWE